MEETKKRQESDTKTMAEVAVSKKPKISDEDGDMGEDIMAWLSVDDETTVSELMKLLETTTTTTTTSATRVKFINNPYTSPLIFQSSSSYVTINGNEETCGSSFSDSDSSLMVSVDMGGIVNFVSCSDNNNNNNNNNGGAWGSNEVEARGWMMMMMMEEEEEEESCDCDCDWDDDTLARFLGEDLF